MGLKQLEGHAPRAEALARRSLDALVERHDELARIACAREDVHAFFVTPSMRRALRSRIRAAVLTVRLIRRFRSEQLRAKSKRVRVGDPGWYG